jgi:hypothetical protein
MIADTAVLTTALVVFIGLMSLRHREFEDTFVGRYWKIFDSKSLETLRGVATAAV